MARLQRFDRGTIAPAKRLDNGWLRVEGRSARTGILEYENPDGSMRRELVLPEELFDPASLDSARMVPVTSPHPAALLDSTSARASQVGSVGENLRADGEYLVAPLMITDGEIVRAIEAGRAELSWGYDCQVDPPDPSLVAKWGAHDGIQRGRRLNHLAIVDKARAGDGARIRLDAAGNQLEFARPGEPVLPLVAVQHSHAAKKVESTMAINLRLDDLTISSDAADLQAVVDRTLAHARADNTKVVQIEKERADKLTATVAHVKANAISRGNIVRSLTAKLDAMKAKMVGCDECAGSGSVDGVKCDYCDSKGSFRFHDAIKAMPGESDEPEEEDAAPPEMVDDDALETDDPEEERVEKTANPAHKDQRATARKAAQKRRADSIDRMVARAAKARASLVIEATTHLGADAKLDGKDDQAIKREVVAKLAPHVKLDGLSPGEIGLLYTVEVSRVAKARADGTLSASDQLRVGLQPVTQPAQAVGNRAAWQAKVDEANRVKYASHERPATK